MHGAELAFGQQAEVCLGIPAPGNDSLFNSNHDHEGDGDDVIRSLLPARHFTHTNFNPKAPEGHFYHLLCVQLKHEQLQ